MKPQVSARIVRQLGLSIGATTCIVILTRKVVMANRSQRRAQRGSIGSVSAHRERPVAPVVDLPPVVPVAGQLALGDPGVSVAPSASSAHHLAVLRRLSRRRRDLERELAQEVAAALASGLSYAEIGRVLDVSRQAVRQRYGSAG
jgi:DNA-directed RNA polymerase specialized sigma24 family protein